MCTGTCNGEILSDRIHTAVSSSADLVRNGQPESMTFLVIDFEYGAHSGESLDVDGHWLIVRHPDLFDINKIDTFTHDLCNVFYQRKVFG